MGVKVVKIKGREGYWIRVNHGGKRRTQFGGPEKQPAEAVAREVRAALLRGDLGLTRAAERPFSAYFDTWLVQHAADADLARSTVRGYETAARLYWKPAFGDRDLASLTRDDVRAVVTTMREAKLARPTQQANVAPLRAMFDFAVQEGHVVANPALKLFKRARRDGNDHATYECPTEAEIAAVCAWFDTHGTERDAVFVRLLYRTGMRESEALGLTWTAVSGGEVLLRQQWYKGRLEERLKGGKGRRVKLASAVRAALRAYEVTVKRAALRAGRPLSPYVFATPEGKPFDVTNWYKRVWQPALKAAEVRPLRIHDLRHAFATHMREAGADWKVISELLGHATVAFTMTRYGHVKPRAGRLVGVEALDAPAGSQSAQEAV